MSAFHALESRVTLVKADGQRLPASAVVQPKLLVIDERFPVEIGDHVERSLPSGLTERYRIADVTYYEIMNHYQCKLERVAPAPAEGSGRVNARDIVVSGSQNVVVQVGNKLHAAQTSSGGSDPAIIKRDLDELNEHVLALLDQDIATKKVLWDLSETSETARADMARLLERVKLIADTGQATDATVRATLELVVRQAEASGGLNKQLVKWASTHPITQNIVASILFELMKAAT